MKRIIKANNQSTLEQAKSMIDSICSNYGLRPGTIEIQDSYESSKGYLLSIEAINIDVDAASNLSSALADVLDIIPQY